MRDKTLSCSLLYTQNLRHYGDFPYSSVGKESACNAVDPDSIPGLGSYPGEGNGNPLQYSCLENLMNKGAWWATVHEVARVGHDLATKPPPPRHYGLIISICCTLQACTLEQFFKWMKRIDSIHGQLTYTCLYSLGYVCSIFWRPPLLEIFTWFQSR